MTVGELVQLLVAYPDDLRVVVNGYEEGYGDLSEKQISLAEIALNTGTHRWEGRHGETRDVAGETPDERPGAQSFRVRKRLPTRESRTIGTGYA